MEFGPLGESRDPRPRRPTFRTVLVAPLVGLLIVITFAAYSLTDSVREPVWKRAHSELFASNPARTSTATYTFEVEPGTNPQSVLLIKKNSKAFLSRFDRNLGGKDIWIVIFESADWGKDKLLAFAPTWYKKDIAAEFSADGIFGPCDGRVGPIGLDLSWGFEDDTGLVAISLQCVSKEDQGSLDVQQIASHELTHVLQNFLGPMPKGTLCAPMWFVEGQAEFVGKAVAAGTDLSRYRTYVRHQLTEFDSNGSLAFGQKYEGKDGETLNFGAYTDGMFATQYLVAHHGWEKLVTLNRLSTFNTCDSERRSKFNRDFERVYGLSLEQFYKEFNPYLLSQIALSEPSTLLSRIRYFGGFHWDWDYQETDDEVKYALENSRLDDCYLWVFDTREEAISLLETADVRGQGYTFRIRNDSIDGGAVALIEKGNYTCPSYIDKALRPASATWSDLIDFGPRVK